MKKLLISQKMMKVMTMIRMLFKFDIAKLLYICMLKLIPGNMISFVILWHTVQLKYMVIQLIIKKMSCII